MAIKEPSQGPPDYRSAHEVSYMMYLHPHEIICHIDALSRFAKAAIEWDRVEAERIYATSPAGWAPDLATLLSSTTDLLEKLLIK